MSEQEGNKARGRGSRVRLNTIQDARRAHARIVRMLWNRETDDTHGRTIVYALGQLVAAFRVEMDLSIEARLAALEEQLAEREARDAAQAG